MENNTNIKWEYFFGGKVGMVLTHYYKADIKNIRVEKCVTQRKVFYTIGNADNATEKFNTEDELISAVDALADSILVCEECGSEDVETLAWVNANTNVFADSYAYDTLHKFCNACNKHVDLTSKNDYILTREDDEE